MIGGSPGWALATMIGMSLLSAEQDGIAQHDAVLKETKEKEKETLEKTKLELQQRMANKEREKAMAMAHQYMRGQMVMAGEEGPGVEPASSSSAAPSSASSAVPSTVSSAASSAAAPAARASTSAYSPSGKGPVDDTDTTQGRRPLVRRGQIPSATGTAGPAGAAARSAGAAASGSPLRYSSQPTQTGGSDSREEGESSKRIKGHLAEFGLPKSTGES